MKWKIGLAIVGGLVVITLSLFGVSIIIDRNKTDELLKKLEPEYLSRKFRKKKDVKVDEEQLKEIRALLMACDEALKKEDIGEEVLKGNISLDIDVA